MKSLIIKKDDDKFSTIDKNDMLEVIGNHSHLNVIENKNQIHKDGTYLLINDEFNEYSLSLTCDKDIISVDGNNATFTAVLEHNGVVCEGKYITFHANDIEQSVKTNQNGIATFVYEPQGAGLVNVIASFMLLQETYELIDSMLITANDSNSINYFKVASSMGITFDDEYLNLTVDTSVSNGNYCGVYWNTSGTSIYGYKIADLVGKSFKLDFDMLIDNDNLNHWNCVVHAYINGTFTIISSKENLTSGEHSLEFSVPSDAERLWVRLQSNNRNSAYTCKTKNWRIYPI